MEQTYTLELKDYLQFQTFLIKRTPDQSRRRLFLSLLVPLLVGLSLFLQRMSPTSILACMAAVAAIWIPLLRFLTRRAMQERVKASAGAVGVFTLAISPELLRVQSPIADIRIRWAHIQEITESQQHIILMLGPLVGYIVPKTVFRDSEHIREFLETARAYKQRTLVDAPPANTSWPPPPQRLG